MTVYILKGQMAPEQQQKVAGIQLNSPWAPQTTPECLVFPQGMEPTLNDSHCKPQSYFMLSLETENKLLPLSWIHFQKWFSEMSFP